MTNNKVHMQQMFEMLGNFLGNFTLNICNAYSVTLEYHYNYEQNCWRYARDE